MQDLFRPIFTTPMTFEDDAVTFHTYKNEISTQAPVEVINQLVELCDGNHTLEEVVNELKDDWSEQSVRGLLETLREHRVVVDGRNLAESVWSAVQNPTPLPTNLDDSEINQLVEQAKIRHRSQYTEDTSASFTADTSGVRSLLDNRRSVREFSGEPISHQKLVDILWASYGEVKTSEVDHRRTVPSGGALFPLKIGLILFESTDKLDSGVYEVLLNAPGQVAFSQVSDKLAKSRRAFVDPMQVSGAAAVIIINGSFAFASKKYGNRSLSYVTLEAGHAAQNAHLVASECDISTVEVGGFYEQTLSAVQVLPNEFTPLTSVVMGHPANSAEQSEDSEYIEFKWSPPITDEYELPYSLALARMSDGNQQSWSSGKAVSPKLARTKALTEAREWHACGNKPEGLACKSYSELESAIDPREIMNFHDRQYEQEEFPLERFDPESPHSWVSGVDVITEEAVWIPADAVYYSSAFDGGLPRYAFASTSGVAAHPDRKQALQNSVLELVERDAFMITYLAKLTQPTINPDSLPNNLRQRIRALEEVGFRVWVKDISVGLAPVVFVFAQSEKQGVTLCSACAGFDPDEALDHALMELEQSVLSVFKGWPEASINPESVQSPHDHGVLYAQADHFQKADFIAHGGKGKPLCQLGSDTNTNSWNELLEKFSAKDWKLLTVPLEIEKELGGNQGLHIIRSIVTEMVPIVFGYGKHPAGMNRIYRMARERGKSITYEDLPTFPHPFA
jgi:thiazole/oxazole-forming peptide maturase SagD family component